MKVLLVDDNANDRKLLRLIFERHGYKEIVEAFDGLDGIRKAREWKPDIIISDALMPRMDGFQFLRKIKTDKDLGNVLFIFHSSVYTGLRDEELALRLGAEGFITKPKEPEEFWREIAAILEGPAAGKEKPPTPELLEEEGEYLRKYSEVVAAKLEEKVRELEESLKRREEAEEALKKSERFLNSIIENIPDMVFVKDARELRFVLFNRAGEELLGYSRGELAGRSDYDFFPPDEADFFTAQDREVLDNKRLMDIPEESIATRHRGTRVLHTKKIAIQDETGAPRYLLGISEDITERKRAEEALSERVMLAELSADIGYSLTMQGDLRNMLNKCAEALVRRLHVAFARIWTFNAAENVLELQASAGMYTAIDGSHSRVPLGGLKVGLIARERKPHVTNAVIGDLRVHDQEWAKREGMVAFAGHPLTVEERLVGVMAIFSRKPFTDVTTKALALVANEIAIGIEHKRAEEEVLKLSSAVEQSPVSIIITDPLGNIEYVNPKFTQITGFGPEEAKGKNPRILKSGETSAEVYERLWAAITSGNVWEGEFHNRKKSGELFWEYATISPVKSREGVITHYIAIKEDITERKRLEEQLRHAQKMEAVGNMASGVAHDFNNILTAIVGFGSILEMKMGKDNPLLPNISHILSAADRAANLTRSLLTFGRSKPVDIRHGDLNEIVRGVEKMLRRLIREDIELCIDLAPGELTLLADVGQIEQVLMNLTTNAQDALPYGGKITVNTFPATMDEEFCKLHGYGEPGAYALLSFADTGMGMEKSVRERIFEPFFTTKEVGKGTGLGLSVCYGIIRQHGGYINCYSEPGKGTVFRLYLPVARAAPGEAKEIETVPVSGGNETLLLAEDDTEVRDLIACLLKEFGYTVIEARDGEEAVAKFMKHGERIRLCLIDAIMPKKPGVKAYEEIRNIRPAMRVIFMSGYEAGDLQKNGMLNEGAVFISKPIMPQELLRKVRETLDG